MPGTDGLVATRIIAADDNLTGVKILILATFETDNYIFQALRGGASGFLLKNTEPTDRLYRSPLTATHVSRVMTKLGAHDRAQLVVLAYESGLIMPGSGTAD